MPQSTGVRKLGEMLNVFSPSWSGARLGVVIKVNSNTNVELFMFWQASDAGRTPYREYRSTLDVYDKDRLNDTPAGPSDTWAEVMEQYQVA